MLPVDIAASTINPALLCTALGTRFRSPYSSTKQSVAPQTSSAEASSVSTIGTLRAFDFVVAQVTTSSSSFSCAAH